MGGTRAVHETAIRPTSNAPTREAALLLTSVQRGEPLANLPELVAYGVGVLGLGTPGEIAPPVAHALVEMTEPHVDGAARSEEHTSELQSLTNLVCRLL